jgi:hypothetical protein
MLALKLILSFGVESCHSAKSILWLGNGSCYVVAYFSSHALYPRYCRIEIPTESFNSRHHTIESKYRHLDYQKG